MNAPIECFNHTVQEPFLVGCEGLPFTDLALFNLKPAT